MLAASGILLMFSAAAQDPGKVPAPEELPIVIVNAGNLERTGIANLISTINKSGPAMVGVNFTFVEKKENDQKLFNVLKNTKNLVMNCNEENGMLEKSYFGGLEYGQCNFRKNHRGEIDYFPPFLEVNGERIEHMAMKMLKYHDPEKYRILSGELKDLSSRHRLTFMKIDYLDRNLLSFQNIDHTEMKNAPKGLFRNKIVLIGYLGDRIDRVKYVTEPEDVFQVPLSHHHHESNPMYATVILANIIHTLIRGELKSYHHE